MHTFPTPTAAAVNDVDRPDSRPQRLNSERAAAMLRDWTASGLSPREFCASIGISTKTFDRWRLRLGKPGSGPGSSGRGLAEVVTTAPAEEPGCVRLEVVVGREPRVLLPLDVSEDLLRRVVRACAC